jgi:hypothetical protein
MTILPMNEEKRLELIQRGFGGTTVAAEAMVMGVSELQYYLIKGRKGQFTAIEGGSCVSARSRRRQSRIAE